MMPILNQQHSLAEEFHIIDIAIIKANFEANLKIKRWKFIHSLSALSKSIRKEADNMIYQSFFSFTTNKNILIEEGFFESELNN